jgi:hypothetical protein
MRSTAWVHDNAYINLRSRMAVVSRRLGDGFMLLAEKAYDFATAVTSAKESMT